jgi:putative membrane protein
VTVVITVVALAVASRLGVVGYALPGLIPLLIGAVSMISRRVVAMFHFTLAHSPRGLRVTRGLTNLTSQSVPIDRIQGLKISQPLLWRSCGWYRVDVDIVGYGAATGENSQSDATSVLLPVATADEVSRALDQVLPGVNLGLIELQRSPARARWLHWFGAHTLRYGWDDAVLITEQGLMTRVRNVVPHAKAQSVRIEQGPLQRRLRLADVHIDTPPGPVNAVARELDESTARALALSQLDRARAARGVDRARLAARRDLAQQNAPVLQEWSEPGEAAVLSQFGIGTDALLGSGSESRVFAPDVEHVLRIYRGPAADSRATAAQLRGLYDHWAGTDPGFEIPQIRTLAESGGRTYTVDRRMSGRELAGWLPQAPLAERRAALTSYLDLALSIGRLPSPVPGFARLVGAGAPQQFASLAEVLNAQLQPVMADSWGRLVVDLPDVRQVWDQWQADIATRQTVPAVVHGDLCPANTFCSRGPDGAIVVTGVVDFSPHTVVADPLMDVTGAVCFLELESYDGARDDAAWLTQQAVDRLGEEVRPWLAVYRRFYGFYFSSAHRFDERLYAWCLDQLRPAVSPAHSLPGSLGPPT